MTRVMLVDDHPIMRQGLLRVFSQAAEIDVVSEVASGEKAITDAARIHPDVVVLDVQLPGMDGIATCEELRRMHPALRVLILTQFPSVELQQRAFDAGATGFACKVSDLSVVIEALLTVASGGVYVDSRVNNVSGLTEREIEVISRLAHGANAIAIAKELRLSHHTVHEHIHNAKRKLRAPSRSAAIAEATRRGVI